MNRGRCAPFMQKINAHSFPLDLVTVPPDPPHILDPNGRRMGSLIGPYDEGESLSITCMSSQGKNSTRALLASIYFISLWILRGNKPIVLAFL